MLKALLIGLLVLFSNIAAAQSVESTLTMEGAYPAVATRYDGYLLLPTLSRSTNANSGRLEMGSAVGGAVFFLRVQSVGTQVLQLVIEVFPASGGSYDVLTSATINANGLYAFRVFPGAPEIAGVSANFPLNGVFRARLLHTGTGNATSTLSVTPIAR